MKLSNCKRCDASDLCWAQNAMGKWILLTKDGKPHHCDDGKIKAVKCKYCSANDLYWAEELNTHTKEKKAVLTESYGLPHACDERLAFLAKEKQDKKDKYEAEKKRLTSIPDGSCEPCKGTGNNLASTTGFGLCSNCHGLGRFSERNKKAMLAEMRRKIWPNMQENYYARRW